MNQELTISKDIVQFLYRNTPGYIPSKAQDVVCIIGQNLFISDKNKIHFEEILNEIDELPNGIWKEEIKRLILELITTRGCTLDLCKVDDISLSLSSRDKIYFSPSISGTDKQKLNNKHPDLEIHNLDSFCSPDYYLRLKNAPCKIIFKNGLHYDIGQILSPYFRSTTTLKIIDQYLPNIKSVTNLNKIFCQLNSSVAVTLCFLERSKYINKGGEKNINKRKDDYTKFENFMESWREKGFIIKEEYLYLSKHIDRYILTDSLRIQIPCLDFIDEYGHVKCLNENDIQCLSVEFKDC